jgi:hypothetical protein
MSKEQSRPPAAPRDKGVDRHDSPVVPGSDREQEPEHEGSTEKQVGDRSGPGAGYDQEPEQTEDQGGVAGS